MRKCTECGSTNIESLKKMKRTLPPKPVENSNKRMSFGRVYFECKCEDCGHKWEEETKL